MRRSTVERSVRTVPWTSGREPDGDSCGFNKGVNSSLLHFPASYPDAIWPIRNLGRLTSDYWKEIDDVYRRNAGSDTEPRGRGLVFESKRGQRTEFRHRDDWPKNDLWR